MKSMWFVSGLCAGLTALSLSMGAVPKKGAITDDTALYQNLSEIRLPKEKKPSFEGDIARLSALEAHYRERNLPILARHPELKGPVERVQKRPYRYAGGRKKPAVEQQAGSVQEQ
jgi:hypothetical protein